MSETRIETTRLIAAAASDIFALLCDPQGHVAIDSSGMLQDADGEPVRAAEDRFVVHMDREALGDHPELGRYDVTVVIVDLEPDAGSGGTLVTSFYDWSDLHPDWQGADIFPVISEGALRGTLGILDRTVRRGYPRGA